MVTISDVANGNFMWRLCDGNSGKPERTAANPTEVALSTVCGMSGIRRHIYFGSRDPGRTVVSGIGVADPFCAIRYPCE